MATNGFGRWVLGLGVMASAVVGLVWGDFVAGQSVPKGLPGRHVLAYVAGVVMVAAGAALMARRSAGWGGLVVAAYYGFLVTVVMDGRLVFEYPKQYGTYSGIAEQVAIAAGGLVVYAMYADAGAVRVRLVRAGRIAFGVCAVLFGGAHFAYMGLTAPLIPKWILPSQTFWAYATAVCFIAAGVALVTGVKARLAAVLTTVMIAAFAVIIHTPTLVANHRSLFNCTESAVNLAIMGAAWCVADALVPVVETR